MSGTPACLGRRFWLAEVASQKPLGGQNRWTGSEHAACSDPVIPWVVPNDMEHERGAFKVNREITRYVLNGKSHDLAITARRMGNRTMVLRQNWLPEI